MNTVSCPNDWDNARCSGVYLDGVRQAHCFEADASAGSIKRYILNEKGTPFVGYKLPDGSWKPCPVWKKQGDTRTYELAWEEMKGSVTILTHPLNVALWRFARRTAQRLHVRCMNTLANISAWLYRQHWFQQIEFNVRGILSIRRDR